MDLKPVLLVVEDDDALRRMLAVSLASLAHVVTAAGVEEALGYLDADPAPALVVTDVMMPGTSGIELARFIRKSPRLASVPIVMLSARTGPRDMVDAINAGARHYVTKPFRSEDLRQKIAHLLRGAPRHAGPPVPLELKIVDDDVELIELDVELVAE